jgi:hypothetical protein
MTIFRTGVAIAALMITVPDWSGDVPLATSPDWFGNVPREISPAAAQAPAGVNAGGGKVAPGVNATRLQQKA